MTMVALPLLVYQRTGSAALSGLLAAVESVPYLVLGLPAGALVDRWDPRRTMVATSVLSGLVMASIPIASWSGLLTTPHLLVAALGVSALFVFFDAAGFGALPALVGRDGVASATGVMTSIYTVIALIGPAAGGVAAVAVGAANLIAVDAASYLVAALLLRRVRWPVAADASTGVGTSSVARAAPVRRLWHDVAEGLGYIWNHRVIRALTLVGAGSSVAGGAVSGLLIVVAVQQLGLGEHDPRVGLLYAAAALGSLTTSLLISRIQKRFRTGRITLTALTVSWITLLCWSQNTAWGVGLLIIALWQASTALATINGIVVRQALTPRRLQARVNTTARMIAWGGTPLGATLGGLLAQTLGTAVALLVTSAFLAVSILAGLAGPLRHVGTLAELIADRETDGEP